MISRRKFLANTGLAGTAIAGGLTGCKPQAASEGAIELLNSQHQPTSGVNPGYVKRRLEVLEKDPKIFLGYPGNMNIPAEGYFKWRDELFTLEIGQRGNNNVGDPFGYRSVNNSHYLEAELIERFGQRFGFSLNDIWGFVSNSGTDSNMHGAYMGRTLLTQKTGVVPKVYYTGEAHYSIQIIRDLLSMEEVLVETHADGGMDASDLARKLKNNNNAPALVLATVGTTFRGSIDNIDEIQTALKGTESYVHLDAALFGGYLHATEYASDLMLMGPEGMRYDSISVSCHKFFGFPGIAGLFITTNNSFQTYRDYFSKVHNPDYISHVPGTITCSRDSLAPALCHYFSTPEALKEQEINAKVILADTEYFKEQLDSHFPELQAQRANDRSNIVYFNTVSKALKKKWVLATIGRDTDNELAHVVVMPHASRKYLDMFLEDLEIERGKV